MLYLETADVPLDTLAPYPGNARRGDVEAIRASIRRLGQYRALVVRQLPGDGGRVVLAGNHTMAALALEGRELARAELIECDDDEARRINLADNRMAELGGYDPGALADLLTSLDGDFAGTGFSPGDLADLLAGAEPGPPPRRRDPDDVDYVPPDEPRTRPGDVWILGGRHRVMCGDATQPADVARLLEGKVPDVLITDPPYCSGGWQEAGRAAGSIGTKRKDGIMPRIANDRLSTRGYMALLKSVLGAAPVPMAYVFTDWRMWVNLFDVAESSGFGVRAMIVWDKGTPGMGRGWRAQHELVMFASRAVVDFDKHLAAGNVVATPRTGNPLHPTQKPVELITRILDVTHMARTVYDPMAGSGTMLIAAEHAARPSWHMELDPAFCDVMVDRFADVFGGPPAVLQEAAGAAVAG